MHSQQGFALTKEAVFDPQNLCKKTNKKKKVGITAFSCNSSSGETGRLLELSSRQDNLIGEFQTSGRPCLKKQDG